MTVRSCPFFGSATNTRVVLDPMSMAAHSIEGGRHLGRTPGSRWATPTGVAVRLERPLRSRRARDHAPPLRPSLSSESHYVSEWFRRGGRGGSGGFPWPDARGARGQRARRSSEPPGKAAQPDGRGCLRKLPGVPLLARGRDEAGANVVEELLGRTRGGCFRVGQPHVDAAVAVRAADPHSAA